jgi:chemotaxis protein methyltransferase CheR
MDFYPAEKEADIKINDEYLDLFREFIHKKLGIFISQEKDYLLHSKLGRLLKKSSYKNPTDFYYNLRNDDKESLENLIRYITTNHTFFFREKMHLKFLRNDILLRKIAQPVIWVAGSSTGEEVYSIIIELLEHNISDFFIIASDINKDVLLHLKKGVYHKDRLKETEPEIIRKYFIADTATDATYYTIRKDLKKYYIAKCINLIEDPLFEKQFDYIFCRNVLIYFDKETQIKVIDNLLRNLAKLGYLFVGHSESLLNVTKQVETVFTSVYSKASG